MFAPFCGHFLPTYGGTKEQYGEVKFRPGCQLTICEECNQLIPALPSTVAATTTNSHPLAIDPSLTAPIAASSVHSYGSSTITNTTVPSTAAVDKQTRSLGNPKSATFRNVGQNGGRSARVAVGTGRPRNTKGKGRQSSSSSAIPSTLQNTPARLPHYNLKIVSANIHMLSKPEQIPEIEQWIPSATELLTPLDAGNHTSVFLSILKETRLWESFIAIKEDCKFPVPI